MVNRSVFPEGGIDQFVELSDILTSDKANVNRYKELLMKETRTTAEDTELINLKTMLSNSGKLISAETLNKIQDAMSNLEDFFLNKTVPYLDSLEVGALRSDLEEIKSIYAKKQQGLWAYAVTQNGWGDLDAATYGVASYMKDEFGFVHLSGVLSGGITTDATTILTLPVGLRPVKSKIFPANTSNGTTDFSARFHILPDGRVQIYKAQLNHITLDGISFMAG